MSWLAREKGKQSESVVVILDGKNTPGDIRSGLLDGAKDVPLYMFIATSDGTHIPVDPGDTHMKGRNYASDCREGEIKQILDLHRRKRVGALVVSNDGIYADPDELAETVNKIRAAIPDIKVAVMGRELALEKPADAVFPDAGPHHLQKQLEEWKLFPKARERGVHPGCA